MWNRYWRACLAVPLSLMLSLSAAAQMVPGPQAPTGQQGAGQGNGNNGGMQAPTTGPTTPWGGSRQRLFAPQGGNGWNQPYASEGLTPGDDYRLGPGDSLSVHLWGGEIDLDHAVIVNPQGRVFLPRLGEVTASGQTPQQLEATLQKLVARRAAGMRVLVLLVQPRFIKVFASGQVDAPGVYVVPAETRLSEVLRLAGGITENGSLRQVAVSGSDGSDSKVDLYKFAYAGDLAQNPKLQAGDRVKVPLIGRRVAFLGQVIHPGLFELDDGDTAASLLDLAGGPSSAAAVAETTVWPGGLRGEPKPLQRLNLADRTGPPAKLADGDIVFIPSQRNPLETSVVYVYGSVGQPGAVPYRAGNRLSDYLNAAGGPTVTAWLPGVRITTAARHTQTEVRTVNAQDILYGGRFDLDPEVGVNDIVFVPESFITFRTFAEVSGLILSGVGLYGVFSNLFFRP
jgi:protein involved in polysaccharide export with SLBB domain